MNDSTRRSPLAVAILGMLCEEPTHPYRMQQLIKERDKGDVVNVRQRASLYRTIARLEHAGLVVARETSRVEKRPERTIYAVTETGEETLGRWLREMLATPAEEFPEFPAAIAHLPLLSVDEARRQLERRAAALDAEIAQMDDRLRIAAAMELPRVFVAELEYARAMRQAELDWVRALVDDLHTGRLTWSADSFAPYLSQSQSPSHTAPEGPAMD